MRIDYETEKEGYFEETAEQNKIASVFYLKYKYDAGLGKSIQTIYYDPSMDKMQYQSVSDFKTMSESIHERNADDDYQNCQVF